MTIPDFRKIVWDIGPRLRFPPGVLQWPGKRVLMDFIRLLNDFDVAELDENMIRALAGAAQHVKQVCMLRRGSAGFVAYYYLRDKGLISATLTETITK